jgi:hypothetical protein
VYYWALQQHPTATASISKEQSNSMPQQSGAGQNEAGAMMTTQEHDQGQAQAHPGQGQNQAQQTMSREETIARVQAWLDGANKRDPGIVFQIAGMMGLLER